MDNELKNNRYDHKPGISCPMCGHLIPISTQHLIYSRNIQCPICGFNLNIDKRKSDKALEILKKISETTNKIENES